VHSNKISLPDYAVYVDPPARLATQRPVIRRPPPRHKGVVIPGVEHPPNSGSIQGSILGYSISVEKFLDIF
jgi:hypothetical protein